MARDDSPPGVGGSESRAARPNRLHQTEPPALRPARKGRGARANPTGRFERRVVLPDLDSLSQDSSQERARAQSETQRQARGIECSSEAALEPAPSEVSPGTQMLLDRSRSAIVFNQSPDIPFDASLNPYRGCEHGCSYCYARPTHEYLGYSAGLDFETKILVKEHAPKLLRKELSASRWKPQVVALSGVTDAYQPIERRLRLTRRCIEIFVEFRNPISVITKNALVTRDIDLFRQLADCDAILVTLSITTLDDELQRVLEPRASASQERLRAVEKLAAAGIPTGVMVAPIIPGLTDSETPAILRAAASAGASFAGHTLLRLPYGLRDLFDDWLITHRPLRRDKVLHRLEALRNGNLNDPRFGSRMRGEGIFAKQIADVFRLWAKKYGLDRPPSPLSTASFRRPGGSQLELELGD